MTGYPHSRGSGSTSSASYAHGSGGRRPSPPDHHVPSNHEPPYGWHPNGGEHEYHDYADEDDEHDDDGDQEIVDGRPTRAMLQREVEGWGQVQPGSLAPGMGAMEGDFSRGGVGGGGGGGSWRGAAHAVRSRRGEEEEWAAEYDEDDEVVGVEGGRTYEGGWGRVRGGGRGSVSAPVGGGGRAPEWYQNPDAAAPGGRVYQQTHRDDPRVALAAEAALTMAGYGPAWDASRGRVVGGGGRGVGGRGRVGGGGRGMSVGEDGVTRVDANDFPTFAQRNKPDAMRVRENNMGGGWGGRGSGSSNRGGGRGYELNSQDEETGSWGRGGEGGERGRFWRDDGAYRGYPVPGRGGGDGHGGGGGGQGWDHASADGDRTHRDHDDEEEEDEDMGEFHDVRPAFAQHRGTGTSDRVSSPGQRSNGRGSGGVNDGAPENAYHGNTSSRSAAAGTGGAPSFGGGRGSWQTRDWTELGAAAAAAAAVAAKARTAAPMRGGERFSPAYYEGYDDPRLPPSTAAAAGVSSEATAVGRGSAPMSAAAASRYTSTAVSRVSRGSGGLGVEREWERKAKQEREQGAPPTRRTDAGTRRSHSPVDVHMPPRFTQAKSADSGGEGSDKEDNGSRRGEEMMGVRRVDKDDDSGADRDGWHNVVSRRPGAAEVTAAAAMLAVTAMGHKAGDFEKHRIVRANGAGGGEGGDGGFSSSRSNGKSLAPETGADERDVDSKPLTPSSFSASTRVAAAGNNEDSANVEKPPSSPTSEREAGYRREEAESSVVVAAAAHTTPPTGNSKIVPEEQRASQGGTDEEQRRRRISSRSNSGDNIGGPASSLNGVAPAEGSSVTSTNATVAVTADIAATKRDELDNRTDNGGGGGDGVGDEGDRIVPDKVNADGRMDDEKRLSTRSSTSTGTGVGSRKSDGNNSTSRISANRNAGSVAADTGETAGAAAATVAAGVVGADGDGEGK